MKIYIRTADDSADTTKTIRNPKTTFYRASIDDVKKALDRANIWIQKSFDESGFECIDTDKGLFGTRVVNDDLYICVTNGEDIEVNGKMVDPEKALDDYDLSELSAYIKDATPSIIKNNIDEYTIRKPKESEFNAWSISLMRDGEDFTDLAEAYTEIWGD